MGRLEPMYPSGLKKLTLQRVEGNTLIRENEDGSDEFSLMGCGVNLASGGPFLFLFLPLSPHSTLLLFLLCLQNRHDNKNKQHAVHVLTCPQG